MFFTTETFFDFALMSTYRRDWKQRPPVLSSSTGGQPRRLSLRESGLCELRRASIQPQLPRDPLQRFDTESYVLIQVDA